MKLTELRSPSPLIKHRLRGAALVVHPQDQRSFSKVSAQTAKGQVPNILFCSGSSSPQLIVAVVFPSTEWPTYKGRKGCRPKRVQFSLGGA